MTRVESRFALSYPPSCLGHQPGQRGLRGGGRVSINAITWAMDIAPIPEGDKRKGSVSAGTCAAVLFALAEKADEYGRNAHPVVPTLVHRTRHSKAVVHRALKALLDHGTIRYGTPDTVIYSPDKKVRNYDLALERVRDDIGPDQLARLAKTYPWLGELHRRFSNTAGVSNRHPDSGRGIESTHPPVSNRDGRGIDSIPNPSVDPSLDPSVRNARETDPVENPDSATEPDTHGRTDDTSDTDNDREPAPAGAQPDSPPADGMGNADEAARLLAQLDLSAVDARPSQRDAICGDLADALDRGVPPAMLAEFAASKLNQIRTVKLLRRELAGLTPAAARKAASSEVKRASAPPAPPWCGACDPHGEHAPGQRRVENEHGEVVRCPTCHPKTAGAGGGDTQAPSAQTRRQPGGTRGRAPAVADTPAPGPAAELGEFERQDGESATAYQDRMRDALMRMNADMDRQAA